MSWWCTATRLPWDWAPRAYPGIWLAMATLLGWYLLARRHAPGGRPDRGTGEGAGDTGPTGRAGAGATDATTGDGAAVTTAAPPSVAPVRTDRWRLVSFLGGWVVLWIATDWPVGALGAGYLASAHMFQFLLYTTVAAPLLVAGIPEWMMRRTLARTRTYRLVRTISQPIVAGVIFNVVLVATHAPITVDAFRSSQLGSFVLDAAWLGAGIVLWLPLVAALDELRPSYAVRGVYLFLAAGVVPMIPGGFLTFADHPLYATYELAPRVQGFDATHDQQLAGALMKVGNIPLIWPVIAVFFFRWAQESSPTEPGRRPAVRSAGT
jgi:putative membrane protein